MVVLYNTEGVQVFCDASQVADLREAGYTSSCPTIEEVDEVKETVEEESIVPKRKVLKTLPPKK